MSLTPTLDMFVRVEDYAAEHEHLFSLPTLKYWIRSRKHNGLSVAGGVLVFGRHTYVHRERFANWLNGLAGCDNQLEVSNDK